MKWILLLFAIWNLAGAFLRTCRILLERFALTRRLYPNRDLRPLDGIGDLDISPAAKERYRAVARELSRRAAMPVPELFCSPKSAILAATRGWRRHDAGSCAAGRRSSTVRPIREPTRLRPTPMRSSSS